jgi:release factor glutamine methyltransferase
LRLGDLFAALAPGAQFDLIVANPPYVRAGVLPTLAPELHHEPALALVSGEDGLDVVRRLAAEISRWLAPGGATLFEIGAGQAEAVLQLMAAAPELHELRAHSDLGGIQRVIESHKRTEE